MHGDIHTQPYLDKILLLQKKALRIICHTSWRAHSHTDILFLENNILKIYDLVRHHLGQFMYKLENKELPNIFYDIFQKKTNLFISIQPVTQTILTHSIFTSAGPKFWNTLDDNLKLAPSIMTFKSRLKSQLLSSYKGSSENHQQH